MRERGMTAEAREKRVERRAHAKLNLGLSVVARRDDGYHEIDTLFARLELHDDLALEAAARVEGELSGEPDVDLQGLRMGSENLAVRAAEAYLQAGGEAGGVHLRLHKRIPVAAGLGGGSSDAAQVLLGLARLYPGQVDLAALGNELGSDLAFFLSGSASAWGRGRGEIVERAELPRLPVVLLNPGIAVSAAEAYGLVTAFDPPLERGASLERLAAFLDPGYRNSLQAGVVEEYPVVGDALEALGAAGLRGVLMSGSGPTCFGLASSAGEARRAAERLTELHPNWWVWWGWAAV